MNTNKHYCEGGHEVNYDEEHSYQSVCWVCQELSEIKNPTKEDEERLLRKYGKSINPK